MITAPEWLRAGFAALVLVSMSGSVAGQQAPRPSPGAIVPLAWTRVLPMPDGRTFVTDGAMMIDITIAKPATVPADKLPPETGKNIAGLMTTPHTAEGGLGDLKPGDRENTFMTPAGLYLSANYVNFLRQAMPVGRTRLRVRGPRDPVVIVLDDRPVGVVMPVAPPR